MGILDEAIREHLELKRQHGAEETELEGLESEAFGPADRPDAVDAPTEVISPGSSLTVPAGEGDQLDKVFEASRLEEIERTAAESAAAETASEMTPSAQQEASAGASAEDTAETTAEAAAADVRPEAEVDDGEPNWPEEQASQAKVDQPAEEPVFDSYDDEGGDAGDALQRERLSLSDHPTEHYDVDAAIAEEEEIDILSESSLSDELDRALDGPLGDPPVRDEAPVTPTESVMPEDLEADEPVSDEFDTGFDDEAEAEADAEAEVKVEEETVEPAEAATDNEPVEGDADFFDQDDPLEATPDFLEETPEHDRLWFEQKPPKDFEFGD